TTDIPANQPLALAYTTIPFPKFTISSGAPWAGPGSQAVPNGTIIGAFGFNIGIVFPPCTPFLNIPGVPLNYVDAALPDYTLGPWAGVPNGGPIEGPDDATIGAPVFNPLRWPVDLEYDAVASSFHSAGLPL